MAFKREREIRSVGGERETCNSNYGGSSGIACACASMI